MSHLFTVGEAEIAAAIAAAIAEDEREHRLATRLTHEQRFAHALAANGEALL